jgi:ubiquinone/menaquinone biosynthesis C-methylase UbiE
MLFFNYSTIIDPMLRDVRMATPKFAGMKVGDKVLDVCCGTGDQCIYYSMDGVVAFGIDLDKGMIRRAENTRKKKKVEEVSFRIADAKNLPFEDNFFDYVSISFALHEKERASRNKIISEMKRVVKRDGRLIFIDFQVPLPGNFYSFWIRCIEYLAGKEHFKYFKDYIKQGGLDNLLNKNQLNEEKRGFFKNGNILMIKAKP